MSPPKTTEPPLFWLTAPYREDDVPWESRLGEDELCVKADKAGGMKIELKRSNLPYDELSLNNGRSTNAEMDLRKFQGFVLGKDEQLPESPGDPPPISRAMGIVLLVLAELAEAKDLQGHAVSTDDLLNSGIFEKSPEFGSLYWYLFKTLPKGVKESRLVDVQAGRRGPLQGAVREHPDRQRRASMPTLSKLVYVAKNDQTIPGMNPGFERLKAWLQDAYSITLNLSSAFYEPLKTIQTLLPLDTELAAIARDFDPELVEKFLNRVPQIVFGQPSTRKTWNELRALHDGVMRDSLLPYVRRADRGQVIRCLRTIMPLAFYFGRYQFWRDVAVAAVLRDDIACDEIKVHACLIMAFADFHLGKFPFSKKSAERVKAKAFAKGWFRLYFISWEVIAECLEVENDPSRALQERREFHREALNYMEWRSLSEVDKGVLVHLARYNARSIAILYALLENDPECDRWLARSERGFGTDQGKWAVDAVVSTASISILRTDSPEALSRVLQLLDSAKDDLENWHDNRWLATTLFKEAIIYERMGEHTEALKTWQTVESVAMNVPLWAMEQFARRKIEAHNARLRGDTENLIITRGSPRTVVAQQMPISDLV